MKTLEKVNYKGFILPLIIGVALWCFTPLRPAGLSAQAWEMFAIFVATIIGCITKPLPIGGTTLIGLIVTVLVGLAPIKDTVDPKTGAVVNEGILSAFGNSASWLIAMAFIMAYGISKTGLGNRIAYWMIRRFGKRSIGIGYAITGLELILGALIPSNSARTGGVVWPVTESISKSYDSLPNDPSRKKIGAYLSFIAFHANVISTALFITGAAPNMVASQMAAQKGYTMTWISWFTAAIVPALVATIVIPLVIYKIFPPEIKETPNAKKWADDRLADMGPVTKPEKIMSLVFLLAIVLWVLSGFFKIPQLDSTFVAFIAVGLLLLTGVLTMKDALSQTGAWNILIWLSILIFMAGKLINYGFIDWFSKTIQTSLHGISWEIVLFVLVILMFYTHYFFASGTAHMTALYLPFLSVAVATGAPLALSAMLLAFTGAINASTTHYANGPASILATTGYIKQSEWWKYNFILGILYLLIFGVIGTFWMKIIGMW